MKNFVFAFIAGAFIFSSCSKDDTIPPDPFKVTSITCTKNGSSTEGFSMNIIYNSGNGTVSNIIYSDGTTDNYQYRSNEIYVINTTQVNATYTLSGDKIASYVLKEINPYKPSEMYEYDNFIYRYGREYWTSTDMIWSRPDSNGDITKYTSRVAHTFTWQNLNLKEYSAGNNIMEFKYTTTNHPVNYPYRILNSVDFEAGIYQGMLIQKENFSPINFFMGSNSRYLIESAKCYNNRDAVNTLAEYDFEYTMNGEGYVTKVVITEKYTDAEGIAQSDEYVINLSYGYDPN